MLNQHIFARNAEIGRAILHISGHIAGTYNHQADIGPVGLNNQLARFFRIFRRRDAGGGQEGQGFVENTAFGKGDGQIVVRHDGFLDEAV